MLQDGQRVQGKINVLQWDGERWLHVWVDYSGFIESHFDHPRLGMTYYVKLDTPIKTYNHWTEYAVHVEGHHYYPLLAETSSVPDQRSNETNSQQ